MNEEQFNKFFRDKLSKYPSSVPDDMWERIQGKKKRRIFFWWLFSGILFISFTAGYFVFQTNTYKTNDKGYGSDKGYVSIDKQKASGNNKDSVRISNTEKNILLQQIKKKETKKKKNEVTEDTKNQKNTPAKNKSTVKVTIEISVPLAKDSSRK